MDWIMHHWDDLMLIVTGIITVASVIVKMTPSKKDDEELSKIQEMLRLISMHKDDKK